MGEINIQEDFAENFQIKYQQEMAAHRPTEMFPVVAYYRNRQGDLQHASYDVLSNETAHDKGCVYAFNTAIIEGVKLITGVKKVLYWSDGPLSQFKNRYSLSYILYHQQDFGFDATGSFLSSILRNVEVVNNPEDFFQAAKRLAEI